ncbi:hypothetical protein [Alkalilimnicola ehrlichii]|uniref:Uncharacterized protein n=2 Tax=Alkalilimnicola ehrlichii TaxID=351052 RepID=A0A3E0WI40_9GAMM|nr:hypothetical protein [Alkalilimnicola ehrlichii]RFA32632.1 hypothetical protein CAL65_19375 [Alkalilimnicola ehrlichii]
MQARDFFVHFQARGFLCFGYIYALIKNDPKILLDTIYSYNRYNQVVYWDTGYDHGGFAWKVLIGYAGNDDTYIDFMLPRSLPLSDGRVVCHIATDCILALRNPELRDRAIDSAERFLGNKRTNNDRATVSTLLSVLKDDGAAFSEGLQKAVATHRQAKGSYQRGIGKLMPLFGYGMLAVAQRYLSAAEYARVDQPKHALWWPDFVAYNEAQGYRPGQHLIEFAGELSFMNDAEAMMEVKHESAAEMRAEARRAYYASLKNSS